MPNSFQGFIDRWNNAMSGFGWIGTLITLAVVIGLVVFAVKLTGKAAKTILVIAAVLLLVGFAMTRGIIPVFWK